MSSFRKGHRSVADDATFVAGRVAGVGLVYQARRETVAASAWSEGPPKPPSRRPGGYERNPRLFVPNWPMYGKTGGRSFAPAPYHCARIAPYWSTDVVGIHRPSFEASSGPFSAKVGKVPEKSPPFTEPPRMKCGLPHAWSAPPPGAG